MNKISKFQYITQDTEEYSHIELVDLACKAGIDWIQLRMKYSDEEVFFETAIQAKSICDKHNARLIINDNVQIAKNVGAHGVHLGKNDISPIEAKKILGKKFVIGGTANTYYDIVNLCKQNIDYIGLGPYRFTKTKRELSPILGIEAYRAIIERCTYNSINKPIVAIGGIVENDFKLLADTGLYGVAVSSMINKSKNIIETFNNASNFKKYFEL